MEIEFRRGEVGEKKEEVTKFCIEGGSMEIPLGGEKGIFNRWRYSLRVKGNEARIVEKRSILGFLGIGRWRRSSERVKKVILPGEEVAVVTNSVMDEIVRIRVR